VGRRKERKKERRKNTLFLYGVGIVSIFCVWLSLLLQLSDKMSLNGFSVQVLHKCNASH
jgi:hypothetical protein